MTTSVAPSTMQTISLHAMERFCERVIGVPLDNGDDIAYRAATAALATAGLARMYRASRPATLAQLYSLHVKVDREADYLISDTSYGIYLLIIKEGVLTTLYSLEDR